MAEGGEELTSFEPDKKLIKRLEKRVRVEVLARADKEASGAVQLVLEEDDIQSVEGGIEKFHHPDDESPCIAFDLDGTLVGRTGEGKVLVRPGAKELFEKLSALKESRPDLRFAVYTTRQSLKVGTSLETIPLFSELFPEDSRVYFDPEEPWEIKLKSSALERLKPNERELLRGVGNGMKKVVFQNMILIGDERGVVVIGEGQLVKVHEYIPYFPEDNSEYEQIADQWAENVYAGIEKALQHLS